MDRAISILEACDPSRQEGTSLEAATVVWTGLAQTAVVFADLMWRIALRHGADWNCVVSFWEWIKLIGTSLLISSALTGTMAAAWLLFE